MWLPLVLSACRTPAPTPQPATPEPTPEPTPTVEPLVLGDPPCDPYGVLAGAEPVSVELLAPAFYPGTYEFKLAGATVGWGYVSCTANPAVLHEDLVLQPAFPPLPPDVWETRPANPDYEVAVVRRTDLGPDVDTLAEFVGWVRTGGGLGSGPLEHYQGTVSYYTVCDDAFAGSPSQDTGGEAWIDRIERGPWRSALYVTGPAGADNRRRIHQLDRGSNPTAPFRMLPTTTRKTEQSYLADADDGDRYMRALVDRHPLAGGVDPSPTGHPPPDLPTDIPPSAVLANEACPTQ